MSLWERDNDEENEENEADEDEEFRSQTDRMIFLIDARESMLKTNRHGETHLQSSLSVALEVIKTKIVAQDASSIGVIFFGCRGSDEGEAPGVFTLFPISTPSAKNIRALQAMIEDIGEFERLVGCQSSTIALCPLKQALWRCKLSFGTKDLKKTDFKRVWIFTNDDYPNAIYPEEQNKVVQIAKDCADGGIELSLWHCDPSGFRPFEPNLFYKRLLRASILKSEDEDDDKVTKEDEDSTEEEIEENLALRMMNGGQDGFDVSVAQVRRKQFRKRRMGQLLFSFTDRPIISSDAIKVKQEDNLIQPNEHTEKDNLFMCVRLYKMVQIVKKPLHTWISMRTNEPIFTATRYLDDKTGAVVANDQIATYVDVQGTYIPYTREEVQQIQRSDPWTHFQPYVIDKKDPLKCNIPGIRLLCCMPQSLLPLHLTVSTPYFLFPGESTIKGSAILFECFLRNLLKKQLVALVRFTRNLSSGSPLPAVLIPQAEVIDDQGVQVTPPGLQCIPLPYMEDIRFNPQSDIFLSSVLQADPSLAPKTGNMHKSMQEYVQAMSLDTESGKDTAGHTASDTTGGYSSYTTDIDNPSLQLFYALLQGIALNEASLAWRPETHDTLRTPPTLAASRQVQEAVAHVSQEVKHGHKDNDDDDGNATSKKTNTASKKRTTTTSSSVAAAPAKIRGRTVAVKKEVEDDEDEDFDVDVKEVKKSASAVRKRTTKVKQEDDDSDDAAFSLKDSEGEDGEGEAKRVVKKRRTTTRK